MCEGEKSVLVKGDWFSVAVKLCFASLCDGHVVYGDGLVLVLLVGDGDGAEWFGFLDRVDSWVFVGVGFGIFELV